MLKRRPLGGNKENGSQGGGGAPPQQGQQQRPAQSQAQQGQNRPQQQRPQRQQQQKQRHHGGQLGQQKNKQNQGQQQQGGGGKRNRNRNRGRGHRPAPPPAFWQRDVLLIANKEQVKAIEEVRLRFDPLSKKLPAHVTLLFSEPSAKIGNDILKKLDLKELPEIKELTFRSIQVIDDMYLWLMPDDESATRLQAWHQKFSAGVQEHTQGEKYNPHITLGYIPRKVPEEEALAFAQNLITTPLTIKFEHLMLEEFNEDQNSRLLDRLGL